MCIKLNSHRIIAVVHDLFGVIEGERFFEKCNEFIWIWILAVMK